MFSGTPVYVSPEQVSCSPKIGTRADLYSLGVILFQLVTGSVPFLKENGMATALARLGEKPPDPRTRRADLPAAVSHLILRCLAREPADRIPSAVELNRALASIERDEDIRGLPLARHLAARRDKLLAMRGSAGSTARTLLAMASAAEVVDRTEEMAPPDMSDAIAACQTVIIGRPEQHAQTPRIRVAVLLFENRTEYRGARTDAAATEAQPSHAAEKYLLHGLTESVIERLATSPTLSVSSYKAVSEHGEGAQEPLAAGRKLRSQAVVTGSLAVLPSGLSATVRIIEVEGGIQFMVRRFTRPDQNIVALSRDIAAELSRRLTSELRPIVDSLADDEVAADLYLRARFFYNQLDQYSCEQSRALFEQALRRQPENPTLHSGHALVLSRLWFGANASYEDVRSAVDQAVRLAPQRIEPRLAQATLDLQSGRPVEAAQSLLLLLRRSPGLAEAHELVGRLLTEAGPLEAGIPHLRYALSIDQTVRATADLARSLVLQGRWDDSFALLEATVHAENVQESQWYAYARMIMWKRDPERARKLLAEIANRTFRYRYPLLLSQMVAGVRKVTLAEVSPTQEQFDRASQRSRAFFLQQSAEFHALVGDRESLLTSLERAVHEGLIDLMWLRHCPLFAELHGHPRLVALCEIVEARAQAIRDALLVSMVPPPSDGRALLPES